jgi:hypothetical protein
MIVCLCLGHVTGSSSDVQKQLSQQMEQISEQHQKQLNALRDEIRAKETHAEILKEYVGTVSIAYVCVGWIRFYL